MPERSRHVSLARSPLRRPLLQQAEQDVPAEGRLRRADVLVQAVARAARRLLVLFCAAAALDLCFPAGAGQVQYPSLAGPLWLRIGGPVVLVARDFPAHRRLFVALEHGRDTVGAHPCCVSTVTTHPRTDSSGRAVIRFTWPRTYRQSPRGTGRWRRDDVAIVFVVSEGWDKLANPDTARATKVAYLRGLRVP